MNNWRTQVIKYGAISPQDFDKKEILDLLNKEKQRKKNICFSCGKKQNKNWKYCPYCGNQNKLF